MFSGESGAAVASGIEDDAATAEKPTYGLILGLIKAASLTLPHHHLCVTIWLDRSHTVGAVERRSLRSRRVRRRLRPPGGGGGHLFSGPRGVPRPLRLERVPYPHHPVRA